MRTLLLLLLAGLLLMGGAAPALSQPQAHGEDGDLIIVALADRRQVLPAVGGSARASYRRSAAYAAGLDTAATAASLAREHGLQWQDSWTIAPLQLHCILFRLAPGADRTGVLAALAGDERVQLAQPLNSFETLAEPPASAGGPNPALSPVLNLASNPAQNQAYNDPYVSLQRGFETLGVAEAQRWTRGEGVTVALIDTGLDGTHPDLQGRVLSQRDFVGQAHPALAAGERHGTQMAGVIAAVANNHIGIVGVAPQARLLAYRACWEVASSATAVAGSARCDSFTLARALGAAIAADPDVINLSLGGPADPLLARLTEHALKRGIIVVGAVPPSGRQEGFPVGVPGVLAVSSSDDLLASTPAGLAAPGRDILTLSPGGGYDFASGSSLAAAQVSGAVALLRALQPRLSAALAQRWLTGHAAVDACAAVRQLRMRAACVSH